MNVETVCAFLNRVIFIHSDDILKTEYLCCFVSNLEGAHDLASVHTVEKVAVVDKEAWADTSPCAKPHEHHVEAEDLHVFDAFAA